MPHFVGNLSDALFPPRLYSRLPIPSNSPAIGYAAEHVVFVFAVHSPELLRHLHLPAIDGLFRESVSKTRLEFDALDFAVGSQQPNPQHVVLNGRCFIAEKGSVLVDLDSGKDFTGCSHCPGSTRVGMHVHDGLPTLANSDPAEAEGAGSATVALTERLRCEKSVFASRLEDNR